MDRTTLRQAKVRIGIGVCTYEAIALAVDEPELLPAITDWSHPRTVGAPLADSARALIALACVAWVTVHLLRPWVRRVRWLIDSPGGGTQGTPALAREETARHQGAHPKTRRPTCAQGHLPCQ